MKPNDKVMTKIMALLERAEHPSTPVAEANLCRDKAEALMAQHMIDRMDLTPEEKTTAVKDSWEIHIGDNHEFNASIMKLLQEVLVHCGIRMHNSIPFVKKDDGTTDYERRAVTIVGFPEDVAYAERIWFNVFRTFVENVNPRWDASKSLSENVYAFMKSGFSWQQVHDIAYAARDDHYGLPPRGEGGGSKLHKAYKQALAERGEEWHVTRRNKAYRSSFTRSYADTIGTRLSSMRTKAKETVSDKDKFALAVISTQEQVDAEFYRLFPEYDPKVRAERRERMTFEAACAFAALSEEEQKYVIAEDARLRAEDDRRWRAASARSRRNFNSMRASDRTDPDAWARGKAVAETVSLRVDAEVKKTKRGELI